MHDYNRFDMQVSLTSTIGVSSSEGAMTLD